MEKKIILVKVIIDIRDEPARPGSAVTLFDGLSLSLFKRYKLEIFSQIGHCF